jgi:hypothetical protein
VYEVIKAGALLRGRTPDDVKVVTVQPLYVAVKDIRLLVTKINRSRNRVSPLWLHAVLEESGCVAQHLLVYEEGLFRDGVVMVRFATVRSAIVRVDSECSARRFVLLHIVDLL